jgi:hypothetical protein
VRASALLAVAGAAVVTGCGAGSATRSRAIQLGSTGGNVLGYTVSIKATGWSEITGPRSGHRKLTVKRVELLGREIQQAHLAEFRRCPGAAGPDLPTRYIRVGSQMFSLRGTCEPRFQRVWNDIVRAVARPPA